MTRNDDVRIARALGCEPVADHVDAGGDWRCTCADARHAGTLAGGLLRYSTDPAAARMLEDEIERRGLKEQYVKALLQNTDAEHAATYVWYADIPDFWFLLRATPEQRAQAFLKAVEDA